MKNKFRCYFFIFLIFNSFYSDAEQASYAKLIPITAIFVAPPCNVSFSDGGSNLEINLGDISIGEKMHPPFSLNIDCKYSRQASIYAEVVTGSLSADDRELIHMQDEVTGNFTNAYLSLKDGSQPGNIEFNTVPGANSGTPICSGDLTRTCVITPVTTVKSGSAIVAGTRLMAAIRFTIENP
ncbi:hypothetical protein C3432_11740 [Citrobacter amalonaticus]|uniref:Fimbrial protein n=1 Tax=Citrobacter amalonaticus TaxID=35703 RepID=A0A2S4RPW3_CITAM|nr:hypothetical protein [Citrobacter amalonaticus]POT58547.1 hypothetical protein C3432_11740 [Citrobacter amalonaticus]POT75927.1 hypothetical protein C3436_00075 [Citrobacter amalonaticus]POU59111.1 hypothetical protein C3430_26925 [Citrobacter amalonaticus]POV05162.1 hypothetical protein C3424_07380 [Citrobacter amalonaticus]